MLVEHAKFLHCALCCHEWIKTSLVNDTLSMCAWNINMYCFDGRKVDRLKIDRTVRTEMFGKRIWS